MCLSERLLSGVLLIAAVAGSNMDFAAFESALLQLAIALYDLDVMVSISSKTSRSGHSSSS